MESVQLVLKLEDQLSGKLRKINRDSTRLQRAVIRVQNQAVRLQNEARKIGDSFSKGFQRAQHAADKLSKRMGTLGGAAVALGAGATTKNFIDQAASFEQTQVRLELLSREYGEFGQVQRLVKRNAETFNLSLGESSSAFADIFARLRPLGKSLSEIQTVFQGFNAVALASGTSSQAASAAFLQLSQALGSGRLQGDEFRSISEQIPGILTLVADEMRVTVGELKQLGSEGKITSDILINALARGFEKNKDKIQELLKESPTARFKALRNATDELSVSIGRQLLPAAEGFVGIASVLVDAVGRLPGLFQFAIAGAIGLAGALGTASAAANLLGIKLTSASIVAGLATLGKFALVAAAVAGFALAVEDAIRKQREFENLIKSTSINDLEDGIEDATGKLKEMEGALQTIEEQAFFRGQAGEAANLRDRIKEAADQIDRLKARRDVLSQTFTIAGIEYDANMVPIKPPPTVSDNREKAEAERLKREEEFAKLRDAAQKSALAQLAAMKDQAVLGAARTDQERTMLQFQLLIEKAESNRALVGDDITNDLIDQIKHTFGIVQMTQTLVDLADDREKKEKEIKKEVTELEKLYQSVGQTISDGIVDSILDAQNATQALGNMLNDIGRQLLRLGVNTALNAIFPGSSLFSALPTFADGGRPPVGRASIVGERGPELFVPKTAGTIVPNHAIGSSNVVVNVDASGSNVQGDGQQGKALGQAIGAAVQAELIKQKRPGGLLS
tara:strand:- start:8837 stop:11041 length:2205 start_codon:yes stop_codon:yes gene_type:complete